MSWPVMEHPWGGAGSVSSMMGTSWWENTHFPPRTVWGRKVVAGCYGSRSRPQVCTWSPGLGLILSLQESACLSFIFSEKWAFLSSFSTEGISQRRRNSCGRKWASNRYPGKKTTATRSPPPARVATWPPANQGSTRRDFSLAIPGTCNWW